jgi:hypothetical protein
VNSRLYAKEIDEHALDFAFTCLAFFCLPWTEHAIHAVFPERVPVHFHCTLSEIWTVCDAVSLSAPSRNPK